MPLTIVRSLAFVFNIFKWPTLIRSRGELDIFPRNPTASDEKQKHTDRKKSGINVERGFSLWDAWIKLAHVKLISELLALARDGAQTRANFAFTCLLQFNNSNGTIHIHGGNAQIANIFAAIGDA